jgi:hypothetical protein
LADVEIFEQPSGFFAVCEEEADGIVGKSPFEVLVVVRREVESESGGAEESVKLRSVD